MRANMQTATTRDHVDHRKSGSPPDLSVVVCLTCGNPAALNECLEALHRSSANLNLECIVPYDSRLANADAMVRQWRWVTFIDVRSVVDPIRVGRRTHEHHHVLRALGIRRARAEIVGMLEDHGIPGPGWCAAVMNAHRGRAAVIGGAVDNRVDRVLNWAIYFCDFSRFRNPVPAHPVEYVTDINIAYKREALWSVRDHWFNAFHETAVNTGLRDSGELLMLDSNMVVYQNRTDLRLGPALIERYVWGRAFGGARVAQVSVGHRCLYASLAFLLPAMRTWRHGRAALTRQPCPRRFFAALPLIVLLELFWCLGEWIGTLTGRPDGARPRTRSATTESCATSPS